MTLRRNSFVTAIALGFSGMLAGPANAAPVACVGGTLDFTVSPEAPFSGPPFNVGQKTILTAVTTGFTATSYAWTISGPANIKDYNESLGTQAEPATPLAWSTTPIGAADLSSSSFSFYWKPSAAQTHPLNVGPEARTITLTVTPSGGGSCVSNTSVNVERNETDANRQPEDFYTSNHAADTVTNPNFGRVVDEHIYWHQAVGGGAAGSWLQFLAWHGYFLRRFDQWRAEFGYAAVAPWYPGRPLPTGPQFDQTASLRLVYNADANRIPTYYTIAGGTATDGGGQTKLADYASLNAFNNSFEGSFHGQVHCNIGTSAGGFFATSGLGFGSMCKATSPKDPMFWRWHGFIDVMYRNFCRVTGLVSCHSGPDPASDPWMGDNAADIAANGTVPSPDPRWLSPDIWSRRAEVTTDACLPRDGSGNLLTVGGIARNCGTSADHENPVAGSTNYLYATLRNTRPGSARTVYAEVAVYIANASAGLAWPADFTMLNESRQFITLHLEPGQTTSIGPLPWVPPSPSPSDHWCLYIRVLSVQEAPLVEGTDVNINTRDSNSIAWRNLKVVNPGDEMMMAMFIVRNIRPAGERLALQIDTAPALVRAGGRVAIAFDDVLQRAFVGGDGRLDGLTRQQDGGFAMAGARARITGLRLNPRQAGAATLRLEVPAGTKATGDVTVTQISSKGVDGGVTLRLAAKAGPETPAGKLPDLTVSVSGPKSARAGADISRRVKLTVKNAGQSPAEGTAAADANGYMVDLVLSRDATLPVSFATYTPTFHEDVLLKGGRVSNTATLTPGASKTYAVGATIPADTPPGTYCLGAVVDPGQRVVESNEANNTSCHKIRIGGGGY